MLILFFLLLIEQKLSQPTSTSTNYIYLPMKKDYKYGDDICYYREHDEKLNSYIYYVKPCEQGKYCADTSITGQPFGFCRDILTNATDFPSYENECSTNQECISGLVCEQTCKLKCTGSLDGINDSPFYHNFDDIDCEDYKYKTIESKYCYLQEFERNADQTFKRFKDYKGKFPGFPKECGKINYNKFTDYLTYSPRPGATPPFEPYEHYYLETKEWISIGDVSDGDFVTDKKFCKSGFTLEFYPNGDTIVPEHNTIPIGKMCVTPTEIDKHNLLLQNPLECVVTYKGKDGIEHKYRSSDPNICDEEIVIQSKLYTEFIEEFKNASEEDQKNCYLININTEGNCQNINLIKLFYFYTHVSEYLFYKDRKKLETVLHFKIQQLYHRYYEFSTYLNIKYLFFLLFLIIL